MDCFVQPNDDEKGWVIWKEESCTLSETSLAWYHSAEISWFFYHSDFTWNQFWGFLKHKICNFNTSRGSEFFIFLNFGPFWRLKPSKLTKFIAPKIAKNLSFRTSRFLKIDFTSNQNDRKFLKFPHCAYDPLPEKNDFYLTSILFQNITSEKLKEKLLKKPKQNTIQLPMEWTGLKKWPIQLNDIQNAQGKKDIYFFEYLVADTTILEINNFMKCASI